MPTESTVLAGYLVRKIHRRVARPTIQPRTCEPQSMQQIPEPFQITVTQRGG